MIVKNITRNKVLAPNAWLCKGLSRFRGLMFKRIDKTQACVLVNPYSDDYCSIHMWFVPQELDVLWVDSKMRVVDAKHCKQWRFYNSKAKAKYVIEMLDSKGTKIGDRIKFNG